MLKQRLHRFVQQTKLQPPSGGCVLKPEQAQSMTAESDQPPSGGCVLKPVAAALQTDVFGSSRLQAAVC